MKPSNTRKPRPTGDRDTAQNKNSAVTVSHLAREILGMVIAALIFAASVWTSVFGATGQFGPGPEISINERLAAGGIDGR